MSNEQSGVPPEILDIPYQPLGIAYRPAPPRRPLWPALILFLLTLISTLAVGSEFARSYIWDEQPFTRDIPMLYPFEHPQALILGIPFSFTLLGILLAHEFGHYFACKIHGIDASYPYFIPAPNLFGTFGAFIRIRSPIPTRRALFDVGISGPIVGFLVAVPAMAYAIATSKIVPGTQDHAAIILGNSSLMWIFMWLFHPGADPASLLLHPVGRAAWMGLFATGLNLLPVWQLDGGHIIYSLASQQHRRISLGVSLVLVAMGYLWLGWLIWGIILIVLSQRFRHPPLLDRWEPLDATRKLWAVAALAIFLFCFIPWPVKPAPDEAPDHARLVGSTSTITAVSGISFDAQKSTQPLKTCASADLCGDFNTN